MTTDLLERLFAGLAEEVRALAARPTAAALAAFTRRHRVQRMHTAYRRRTRRR